MSSTGPEPSCAICGVLNRNEVLYLNGNLYLCEKDYQRQQHCFASELNEAADLAQG